MVKIQYALLSLCLVSILVADETYRRPDPPPLAHSLTSEQIDRIVDSAPANAQITLPASYAKQLPKRRSVATNALAKAAVEYLQPVIDDSRANIPETADLPDVEIALLYLLQMKKSIDVLMPIAPSNTVEYIIGAGMRQDILAKSPRDSRE